MQAIEFRRSNRNFGSESDLLHSKRQDAAPPIANVGEPADAASPKRPTQLEKHDRRNRDLTVA